MFLTIVIQATLLIGVRSGDESKLINSSPYWNREYEFVDRETLLDNTTNSLCDWAKNVECSDTLDLMHSEQPKRSKRDGKHDGHKKLDHHFGYGQVDEWSKTYPTCAGQRQSPINIEGKDVMSSRYKKAALHRKGYDIKPISMRIGNSGHSVRLTGEWQKDQTPTVYGDPLIGIYQFAEVHFHWGKNSSFGSEHTINNTKFPLEMHMVHWNKKYYNYTEALKHGDGIAVLAYFMSLGVNGNEGIKKMDLKFLRGLEPGKETEIPAFSLTLFDLDWNKEGLSIYPGSLTTPPCSESVTWIISMSVKNTTEEQLETFRAWHLNDRDDHNHRPTQPLNGRSIFYYSGNPA